MTITITKTDSQLKTIKIHFTVLIVTEQLNRKQTENNIKTLIAVQTSNVFGVLQSLQYVKPLLLFTVITAAMKNTFT